MLWSPVSCCSPRCSWPSCFLISLSFAVSVLYTKSTRRLRRRRGELWGALMAGFGLFHAYPTKVCPPTYWSGAGPRHLPANPVAVLTYFVVEHDRGGPLHYSSRSSWSSRNMRALSRQFVEVYLPLPDDDLCSPAVSDSLSSEGVRGHRQERPAEEDRLCLRGSVAFPSLFTTWYVNNGLKIPVGFNSVF